MEFIILGLVLFIAGIAATIIYDKAKAEKAKREELYRSAPPKPTRTTTSAKKGPFSSSASSLDSLLKEAKTRQQRGHTTVEVQTGTTTQTMTVEDLIKRIEQMKKKL